MPATYSIDSNRKLVTSRLWGAVSEDELHDHNERLRGDPEFVPDYRQLTDITGLTEILIGSKAIIQTAIDQFFVPGTRRAIVASSEATFGMARMFALQSEGSGQTIEVFREMSKAEEWLGIA
jgi:hypothetical protein